VSGEADDFGIAVICLGYLGNPAGVVRLARYFAAAGARLYVHIDAKADIAPYAAAVSGLREVVLLDRRQRIYWGGFSLVRAVIDAIGAARAQADYARICLLTEDTVPLLDAASFRSSMRQDCEFMHVYHDFGEELWQRYRGFYYFDAAATNPRSNPADRVISAELTEALGRLEALRRRGKLALDRMHHGSTWWALSRRAIDEILLHWTHSTHLRESFEFSMIPEEQYFQTILGNAARRFTFRPFMHADFNREPRPYVYRTAAELAELRSMPLPFARKGALDSAEVTAFIERLSG
jgi:hypothetical protein